MEKNKNCRIKIYVRRKPSSGSGIYRVTRTRYLKSPLDFSDFRCLRIGRTTGHFSSTEEPEVGYVEHMVLLFRF